MGNGSGLKAMYGVFRALFISVGVSGMIGIWLTGTRGMKVIRPAKFMEIIDLMIDNR